MTLEWLTDRARRHIQIRVIEHMVAHPTTFDDSSIAKAREDALWELLGALCESVDVRESRKTVRRLMASVN